MRTIELRQKRAGIFENTITPIIKAAQSENRNLSSEEQEKVNRAEADMADIKATYEAEERSERLALELNESIREPQRTETRGQGAPVATRAQRVASDEYRTAFNAYLLGGMEAVAPEHRGMLLEHRAQSVGTTTAGGYTVPQGFRATLMESLKAFGGMRQGEHNNGKPVAATIITTESGNTLPIPTVNETAQTGELVAENTAVTAQDATFSVVNLAAYKYSSKSILVSFELLQDSAIDLNNFIARALGTRLGRIQNTHFTTGTGSSQPQGIITGATNGKTAASATAVTYLEVLDLIHSVDRAHRQNAQFMFNDSTLKALKQLQDTQGRPLWLPGVSKGEEDMFLGYRYSINQDMATIATGAKTICFGDFSYYMIRDVMDVTLYRITDKYIEQGSVGFLAYMRSDGKYVNPGSNPVKFLTQA